LFRFLSKIVGNEPQMKKKKKMRPFNFPFQAMEEEQDFSGVAEFDRLSPVEESALKLSGSLSIF
jgi:hypothetical protein